MKIYLIRHGKTKGNEEKRYVGTTDERLLPEERDRLAAHYKQSDKNAEWLRDIKEAKKIYVSPMKRCIQTAIYINSKVDIFAIDDFRECDFGYFEYKNHEELIENQLYLEWLKRGGDIHFPNGESRQEFIERVVRSFRWLCSSLVEEKPVVLVVHGGTIMSILHSFSQPHKDYYDWQTGNGQGFVGDLELDGQEPVIKNIRLL